MDWNAITGAEARKLPGETAGNQFYKINIYGKGLTPRVSMGDGGSK